MLLHNLKIATRNLMKYKVQHTISVLSMAIGIVVLAAVHSFLHLYYPPLLITTTPHYDRAYRVFLDSIRGDDRPKTTEQPRSEFDLSRVWPKANVVQALTSSGEYHCVELGPTFPNGIIMKHSDTFCLGDTLRRRTMVAAIPIEASYPHYAGYRSALTDEPVAVLKSGEAILSERMARSIFGDVCPVGAILEYRSRELNLPIVVVDVYQDFGMMDGPPESETMLYALEGEKLWQVMDTGAYSVPWLNVMLKPGCTPEQLEQEMNLRLAPFGLQATVKPEQEVWAEEIAILTSVKTLGYLLGSLILLAASVGFLRMQMQLFRMRGRELSLRIVNGAKRRQLFATLMTEVGLVIASAVAVAMLCGSWLEPFVNTLFSQLERSYSPMFRLENLGVYCLAIGGVLCLLCGVMVWATLARICKGEQGLSAHIRGSRNHTFRHVMLWLQVTVGMLFVCAALWLAAACRSLVQMYILPEDETPYRESLVIRCTKAENPVRLSEELSALPDVAQIVPMSNFHMEYEELNRNDSIRRHFHDWTHFRTHSLRDTTMFDFYRMPISWLRPELKGEACLLVQEDMYALLQSQGIAAGGALTPIWRYGEAYPVAGTFKEIPFEQRRETERSNFILIDPSLEQNNSDTYVLVPREGRYGALLSAVESTVARVEPDVVDRMVYNFYEYKAPYVQVLAYVRQGGWVLGGVALLVCIMSIYSTIALDTRARRKEVAIRKINGAKAKDIALMFARLYVVLTALAVAVVLPLTFILKKVAAEVPEDIELPIVPLGFVGCLTVILTIVLIVGSQVRAILRINPTEMIAKE